MTKLTDVGYMPKPPEGPSVIIVAVILYWVLYYTLITIDKAM